MHRDSLDVLHHGCGREEDVAIDVLQNVTNERVRRLAGDEVRFVDVALPVGREGCNFTMKLELAGYGREIVGLGHGQSCSG